MILALIAASVLALEEPSSCFLLHDEREERTMKEPSSACSTRVTPASTFKIPHAVAALDSGVIAKEEVLRYDGSDQYFDVWKRDHDLASAMAGSVVWYFQRIAERLGSEREARYLKAFRYGNEDASGPLTSFWLEGSLRISPEEQLAFLRSFFAGTLPVHEEATRTVIEILKQPEGLVVNAAGEHALAAPWPPGTALYAKTGRGLEGGRPATWLVGRVVRGDRAWVFVSLVLGDEDPLAAVSLAARRLEELGVL